MKRRFSLSRLLHNDKLMMLLSLLLAVLIWALVVFGPSNTEEQVISGVPIAVTLNDYASQTLNLRLTEGNTATATVRVRGLRSVVSRLSAADITVMADTGNVIKEGTYTLPLRAVSNGDYTIQSVVGPDGNNDTVTISCDVWREAFFPVTVELPNLKVADEKNFQLGTPVVNNDSMREGMLTLTGPRTDINRVHSVVAMIADEALISESGAFTATLEARDYDGKPIDSISYTGIEDKKVSVTVPVLVYREATLDSTLLNVPLGYQSLKNPVTIKPSKLAVWGLPSEIDDYINNVKSQLVVDFNYLTPDNLTRKVFLDSQESIRPVNGSEIITLRVNLSGITHKTFDVSVSENNLVAENLAADLAVVPKQTKFSVTLCGPREQINQIHAEDLRLHLDMAQVSTGLQTLQARVTVEEQDKVWAVYEDGASGTDLLVSVDKK